MFHALVSTAVTAAAIGFVALVSDGGAPAAPHKDGGDTIYQFKVRDIDGEEVSLAKYRGQVCLIVNTASR